MKESIFICGLAVDTVFEIAFSAWEVVEYSKMDSFLIFNFNCEFNSPKTYPMILDYHHDHDHLEITQIYHPHNEPNVL